MLILVNIDYGHRFSRKAIEASSTIEAIEKASGYSIHAFSIDIYIIANQPADIN